MAIEKDFTPREIEVFAAVMLHGTTTKAADALNITQPAVSKTLVLLTTKAGFQLFKKNRQRLIPTPEAHMLNAEVQRVFESARGISLAARDIREMRNGRLKICALPAFGLTLLPAVVSEFSRRHPTVSISVDIRSSITVVQRASRNQLDIGIGVTTREDTPSISRRSLTSTPPVCVMPKGHPLSRLKVVQAHDLEGLDFISMAPADPMRLQLDALCEENDVTRNLRTDVSLSSACIGIVASGGGVSVVDRLSAWMSRDLPIEIRDFRPHLDLNLSVYRPWGVIESSIADAFTDHLVRYTRNYMNTVDAGIEALAAA
jgi:DNA-binding transcriptional LysR family regulator